MKIEVTGSTIDSKPSCYNILVSFMRKKKEIGKTKNHNCNSVF